MKSSFRFFKFTYLFVISLQLIHLGTDVTHQETDVACFLQTASPSLISIAVVLIFSVIRNHQVDYLKC